METSGGGETNYNHSFPLSQLKIAIRVGTGF